MTRNVKKVLSSVIVLSLLFALLMTDTLTYVSASAESDSDISVEKDSNAENAANLIQYNQWLNQQRNHSIKVEQGEKINMESDSFGIDVQSGSRAANVDDADIVVDGPEEITPRYLVDVPKGRPEDVVDEIRENDVTGLLVKTEDDSVIKDKDVVDSYDNTYIMGYDNPDMAANAYLYYNKYVKDGFVQPNTFFFTQTGNDLENLSVKREEEALSSLENISNSTDITVSKNNVIALIDTGVPKSSKNVIGAVSVLGGEPWDDAKDHHGTEMLSVMTQVMPDAKVLSIKALDYNGYGDVASVWAGIKYAISQNVSVINLSLCGKMTGNNVAIQDVINEAVSKGIVVVGAAGNYGSDVRDYIPGNMKNVYVVGAAQSDGWKHPMSNYGDTVRYNVVADSTSEAAARFSAYVAKNNCDMSKLDAGKNTNGWLFEPKMKDNVESGVDGDGFLSANALGINTGGVRAVNGWDCGVTGVNAADITSAMQYDVLDGRGAGYLANIVNKRHKSQNSISSSRYLQISRYDSDFKTRKAFPVGQVVKLKDEFSMYIPKCGIGANGESLAMVVKLTDIEIKAKVSGIKSVSILRMNNSHDGNLYGCTLANTYACNNNDKPVDIDVNGRGQVGVCFNVWIKLTTSPCPVSGSPWDGTVGYNGICPFGFNDLDQSGYDRSWSGKHGNYQEGVTLYSGWYSPMYVNSDYASHLAIDTTSSNNTRVFGKHNDMNNNTGLSANVSASGMHYKWSGFHCETRLVYRANVDLPRYTITPSMAGPGSIAPNAQFEVRGGQTKTVFFLPNQYCHVVSVTTDGVAQSNAVNLRSQTFTNIRADHSVHVVFANDTFKVHYDPNGASNPNQQTGEFTQNTVTGTMADSNYTVGVTGSLRTNAFVREGYTFKGWNTNANGTGVFYPDGYASVDTNFCTTHGATITLYAQWEKKLGTETIKVVSEETGAAMPNIGMKLYKNVNGVWTELPGSIRRTDANGQVSVSDLHWFDYKWVCTSVPAGYQKFSDVTYRINYNALSKTNNVILYMKHCSINLQASVNELISGEHYPGFMYHITGTDVAGVSHSYNVMVPMSGLTGSNVVPDVFAGIYTVTQVPVSRYKPQTAVNVLNATPSGINASVNVRDNTSATVKFPYKITQYQGFSHTNNKTNKLYD